MSRIALTIILLSGFCSALWGQSQSSFGFNMEMVSPSANLTHNYQWGIGYGWLARFDTESPLGVIAFGASAAILPGKKVTINDQYSVKYRSEYLITIFLGPQFKIAQNWYFLPAISGMGGRYYDWQSRQDIGFGFEFRTGILIPIGQGGNKIDIGGKWCHANFLSQAIPEGWEMGLDLEKIVKMVGVYVGYHF